MVWYPHLLKNFPQFVVIYTVKGFSAVKEEGIDIFLEFPYFFCDPACVFNLISGSSAFSKSNLYIWKFSYYWNLAWRILSIILLAWVQLYSSLNIHWHCRSLGLEWKLTFSSPESTAEFSKLTSLYRKEKIWVFLYFHVFVGDINLFL